MENRFIQNMNYLEAEGFYLNVLPLRFEISHPRKHRFVPYLEIIIRRRRSGGVSVNNILVHGTWKFDELFAMSK